jgi:hypothetical protein
MIPILSAIVIAAIVFAAWRETMPDKADLPRQTIPGVLPAGVPPYAPHSEETAQSARPARDLVLMVLPYTPPMPPYVDYSAQYPIRRKQANLAAFMDMGNGRDAGWMAYAAAEATRTAAGTAA